MKAGAIENQSLFKRGTSKLRPREHTFTKGIPIVEHISNSPNMNAIEGA
jgi:hypothetical protein